MEKTGRLVALGAESGRLWEMKEAPDLIDPSAVAFPLASTQPFDPAIPLPRIDLTDTLPHTQRRGSRNFYSLNKVTRQLLIATYYIPGTVLGCAHAL